MFGRSAPSKARDFISWPAILPFLLTPPPLWRATCPGLRPSTFSSGARPTTAEEQFARVLNQEVSMDEIIAWVPNVPALQDDRPINEYFLLRRLEDREYRQTKWKHLLARVGRKPS